MMLNTLSSSWRMCAMNLRLLAALARQEIVKFRAPKMKNVKEFGKVKSRHATAEGREGRHLTELDSKFIKESIKNFHSAP